VDRVSTPQHPAFPDGEDLRGLARGMRLLFETAARTLSDDEGPSELAQQVSAHLGCALPAVVQVAERFPSWEHVNIQRGVDAYLAAHPGAGEWFGVSAMHHGPHEDVLSLINMPSHSGGIRPSAPSYGTAAIGPDESTEVVTFGLVEAAAPDGAPVVIGIRNESRFGPPFCDLEILAADRSAATATRDEIDRHRRANDVFRGQVLSFTVSEHRGNELVTFLPRQVLAAEEVVLPEGVLDHIEQHIIGIADWSRELLSAGQHLKRGLLLHGPPGTGKTHTVRYLTGRLADCTVILLTGLSIRFIDQAAALARRLQPSVVVLEDVDLVALDRDYAPGGQPLLFSLLEAMDGTGTDADVTFVLTTNRADVLEVALADRPGRIDLAIEIPRPDAECRRRLLDLYARDLTMQADLDPVVTGTEGVTASFIKEMIRRTVLVSLRAGERPPVLRDSHFAEVLAEMNGERHALTRSLLGVGGNGDAGAGTEAGPAEYPGPGPMPRPGPVFRGGVRYGRRWR
jgi:ATPase family associated with various cellular activities (AAA)